MDEYIKREDALNAAHKIGKKEYDLGNISKVALVMIVKDYLRAIPAANVRPVVRGKWINVPHKLSRVCSICEHDEPYKFAEKDSEVYNFCPNCGADMREES